jgi:MFS family permease
MTEDRRAPLRDHRLYLVFGITLMGVMGVSSITPAFPTISGELGLSSQQVGLLLTVFTIPGVFLAPVLGFLSDRFGRKRIIIPALLLFGAAGTACGFMESFPVLLVLRFFQGVGAASLISLSVTLLGDMYRGLEREAAVGYNASALSIGTASYPIIGGAFAAIGWQYPFFLSAVAFPIALLVATSLDTPRPNSSGTVLSRIRAVLTNAWRNGIATLSVVAILAFVLLYGAYLAYMPFLLEGRFGLPAPLIGAIMSSMSIATAVTSSRHGAVAARLNGRSIMTIAFGFYIAALLIIPLMPRWWLVPLGTLTYGVAQGLTIPTLQSQIASRAPMELRGATLAVNAMAIRIGQTIGPLLTGTVYAFAGINAVFFATAAVPLLMGAVLWWGWVEGPVTKGKSQ